MGLDSVEIVMCWEQSFGVKISEEEAARLVTPRMAIDLVVAKLDVDLQALGRCLTARAFYRLRRALIDGAGVSKREVRPSSRICDLLPSWGRETRWKAVQKEFGRPLLPGPTWWGRGSCFTPITVGDFANWIASYGASEFKFPETRWTRSEIRTVIRAAVTEVCGVRDFSDDARFIEDIGID
jgi:acyl carrier protein